MTESSVLGLLGATHSMDSTAGSMAAANGSNQDLKEFGRALIREHHALHREADDLGRTLGVGVSSPAVAPDAPNAQLRAALNQPAGTAWDRAYLTYVVALHESAMENTARALAATKSPAVRKYIESSVPILQKHLDKARQLLHKSR